MLLSRLIVARFIHIMHIFYLREKASALEATVFTRYYLLISFYYFHRFSPNQVAFNLDPTVALTH